MELTGRVAVVTGGASGIGADICRRFAAAGAVVVAVDRVAVDHGAGDHAAGDHAAGGLTLQVDVSRSEEVDAAMASVVEHHGRIDVLAHVAGVDDARTKADIAGHLERGTPLDITASLTDEQWHRMTSINLDGTFYCIRAALRTMLPRRSGSIIAMSSVAGLSGVAGLPHYSASKAGVIGLVRAVAKEVADRGVRVNAIAPGAIATPMTERSPAGMSSAAPIGRMGRVDEVSSAALFLAGDGSSYVTGEVVNVSGGLVAG
jgi:NAD(P)-dependent dehydrogenase (short-subunit alcohol dehydrogenase family)